MTLPNRSVLAIVLASAACNGAAGDGSAAQDQSDQSPALDPRSHDKAYTKTRYPIVLAHGLLGFKELFGVLDYFYDIPNNLEDGGARAFATQVSAVNSSEARGEQLLAQVERIAAMTGGKVNLIGHSQGGMDARYVMGVRPDLIASLTSVGSPHLGADLADYLLSDVAADGSFGQAALAKLGNAVGTIEWLLSGAANPPPQDTVAALHTLSTPGALALAKKFPAGLPATPCGPTAATNGTIPLFSWAGTSVTTNVLDISDPVLDLTSGVYTGENDGLVGRCSAHFGKVLRDDYHMNHLDEVNQVAGLVSVFESSPVSVYRAHANRLKILGL